MRERKACRGCAPGVRLTASVLQIPFATDLFTGSATVMQRWARQRSCHILLPKLTITEDNNVISIGHVYAQNLIKCWQRQACLQSDRGRPKFSTELSTGFVDTPNRPESSTS